MHETYDDTPLCPMHLYSMTAINHILIFKPAFTQICTDISDLITVTVHPIEHQLQLNRSVIHVHIIDSTMQVIHIEVLLHIFF